MRMHPHADARAPFDWLRTELDRLFDSTAPQLGDGWTPPLTLHETESSYELRLLIAGADPEKLDIRVEGAVVRISGERPGTPDDAERRYTAERFTGPFRRELRLPAAVDVANVEAHYRNGVVEVTLPKAREAMPRRIPVEA